MNASKTDVAALHVVKQTTRRRNENLRYAIQRTHLLGEWLSAIDNSNLQPFDKVDEMLKMGFVQDVERIIESADPNLSLIHILL